MELILKLPKDKPAFMGIVFTNIYEASTLNQKLANDHKSEAYQMILESNGSNIDIILKCNSINFKHKYVNVKCDWLKLTDWLRYLKPNEPFNFSHITQEFNKDNVVKTLQKQKLFVLSISNLQINNL
jgi:hypothetical protein